MARSENIYGIDKNDFAQSISRDALNPSGSKEDFWGATFDQDARAKGNVSSGDGENPTAKATNTNSRDGRAKTTGNHGAQD